LHLSGFLKTIFANVSVFIVLSTLLFQNTDLTKLKLKKSISYHFHSKLPPSWYGLLLGTQWA